jgi:putative transcription factor
MQTEYCELCGAPLARNGKLVSIEGAKPMKVCEKCAKLGVEIQAPKPAGGSAYTSRPPLRAGSPVPRRRDMFDYIEGDIAEDFPKRIAAARQAKGFTQKDLAFILKMQEGDIKKLERGDREPTEAERMKLEKELGISLIDTGEDKADLQRGPVPAATLGDMISVKRK